MLVREGAQRVGGHFIRVRRLRVWIIPAAYVIAAIALSFVFSALDRRAEVTLGLNTDPDTARDVLAVIGGGMITFTGIVFSMVFLMIQFSATAYSPRLTRWFRDDRTLLNCFGIFTATFVFALCGLARINATHGPEIPTFTIIVAFGLLLVSVGAFLALMERVGQLQLTNVLQSIG